MSGCGGDSAAAPLLLHHGPQMLLWLPKVLPKLAENMKEWLILNGLLKVLSLPASAVVKRGGKKW